MNTGLLWYDGDPKRPLETKIQRAARRHRTKYGRWPNTCHVHPAAMDAMSNNGTKVAVRTAGADWPGVVVRVVPDPTTLPAHFWLGCEERAEVAA